MPLDFVFLVQYDFFLETCLSSPVREAEYSRPHPHVSLDAQATRALVLLEDGAGGSSFWGQQTEGLPKDSSCSLWQVSVQLCALIWTQGMHPQYPPLPQHGGVGVLPLARIVNLLPLLSSSPSSLFSFPPPPFFLLPLLLFPFLLSPPLPLPSSSSSSGASPSHPLGLTALTGEGILTL